VSVVAIGHLRGLALRPRRLGQPRLSDASARTRAAYRARSASSMRSRHWPLVPRLKNAAGSIQCSGPPPGTVVSALLRIDSNVAAWTRRGHRCSSTSMPRRAAICRICPSRSALRSS
jgi:hypothetical protein